MAANYSSRGKKVRINGIDKKNSQYIYIRGAIPLFQDPGFGTL